MNNNQEFMFGIARSYQKRRQTCRYVFGRVRPSSRVASAPSAAAFDSVQAPVGSGVSAPADGRPALKLCIAAAVALVLLLPRGALAVTITNVTPVNVSPSSFSILWRTANSTPTVAVFSDSGGVTNLAGQLGIEAFPLHTGSPDVPSGYFRRQSQAAIRQLTQSDGLMLVRVTGCQPATTYYYRLTSTVSISNSVTYPASGPLPSVTTAVENSFVTDDQQLVLDVPGDTLGEVVTISNTAAAYPLAAVVGDGVGTNQVFFNVNDLFALAGGTNFAPLGPQQFTAQVLTANPQLDSSAQFTLTFSNVLSAVNPSERSIFVPAFLNLSIGSTILQTGQTSSVPVVVGSIGVTNLSFAISFPSSALTNFVLLNLAPELDPALTVVTAPSPSNYVFNLVARAGQTVVGPETVAQIGMKAAGSHSAFMPMRLQQLSAHTAGGVAVANLSAAVGRVVIVGAEPLVEAMLQTNRTRSITLYGNPNASYLVQFATNLNPPQVWTSLSPVVLTNLSLNFEVADTGARQIFYRAARFTADPPVLQAMLAPDLSRNLVLFGVPGVQYTLEATTTLSPPAWTPQVTTTLTNSYAYLPVARRTNPIIFYRLRKN